MLLVRKLPAVLIEPARRSLVGRRAAQIPGLSGLDGTAGGSVLGGRVMRLVGGCSLLWTKPQTHIRGQPLEQSAGIPRLAVMSFFGLK